MWKPDFNKKFSAAAAEINNPKKNHGNMLSHERKKRS